MEGFLRDFFLKYDSLSPTEKKKLITNLNNVLGDVKTVNKPKTTSQPKKGKYDTVSELVEKKDLALYEKLRQWRNKVAKDLDLQPWLVFNNAVLTNIAFYKPQNPDDLLKINGIGPEKVGKYSEALLEMVTSGTANTSSPKKINVKASPKTAKSTEDELDPFEQPVIKRRLNPNK
jgi:superfamily II DNA helicase RecQ